MPVVTLRTERLTLRAWTDADRAPFAALNCDPRVMEHFPSLLTREESDALVARIVEHFARHGYGLWALERDGAFVGYAGLSAVAFEAAFTPAIEIGWRLAHAAWGQGYASEAARAVLRYAFGELALREVVSFTAVVNVRSRKVMERIGMRAAGEFDHPRLPGGHPLRRHVLFRALPEK